jgi:hypothetical protein
LLQATGPLEAALLAVLLLWLASWSLDRHTKAAQLLSSLHLRLLSAALTQEPGEPSKAASAASSATASAAEQQQGPAARAAAWPATASAAGEPGSPPKDISSFRLPEGGLGGSAAAHPAPHRRRSKPGGGQAHQQRWSVDAAGGFGGVHAVAHRRTLVGVRPKPRTSLDFEAAPATPRRSRPQSTAAAAAAAAHRHRARRQLSVADHRAAPQLASAAGDGGGTSRSGGRRSRSPPAADQRWQPRMQRIASGQQLAELAAAGGQRDSGELIRPPPLPAPQAPATDAPAALSAPDPRQHQQQPQAASAPVSVAAAVAASGAAAAPPISLTSWLPAGASLLSWAPASLAAPLSTSSSTATGEAELLPAGNDASGGGPRGAVESAALVAAASGVDPTEPLPAAAAAPLSPVSQWVASTSAWASSTVEALLWRSPSCSQLHSGSGGGSTGGSSGEATSGAPTGLQAHRRLSVDGGAARQYSHGDVAAAPHRRDALLAAARAARGGPPAPSLALSPAAATSALASVGLDGDCPQVGVFVFAFLRCSALCQLVLVPDPSSSPARLLQCLSVVVWLRRPQLDL